MGAKAAEVGYTLEEIARQLQVESRMAANYRDTAEKARGKIIRPDSVTGRFSEQHRDWIKHVWYHCNRQAAKGRKRLSLPQYITLFQQGHLSEDLNPYDPSAPKGATQRNYEPTEDELEAWEQEQIDNEDEAMGALAPIGANVIAGIDRGFDSMIDRTSDYVLDRVDNLGNEILAATARKLKNRNASRSANQVSAAVFAGLGGASIPGFRRRQIQGS